MSDVYNYLNSVSQVSQFQDAFRQAQIQKETTQEIGKGVLELKGAEMLREATNFKNLLSQPKEYLNSKLKEGLETVKDKVSERVRGVFEGEQESMFPAENLEELPLVQRPGESLMDAVNRIRGEEPALPQLSGDIELDTFRAPLPESPDVIETAEEVGGPVAPQPVAFTPLSPEDHEAITAQVQAETEEFRNNLVPQFAEQDEFDMQAQRLYDGSQGIIARMETLDPESSGYKVLGKTIIRNQQKVNDLSAQKEAETGDGNLRVNRVPTDDEYAQIEQFSQQRHAELLNQRQAELNPPQPEPIAEPMTTAPEGITEGLTAGEQELGQVAGSIAETGERIGEVAGRVAGTAEELPSVFSQVGSKVAEAGAEAVSGATEAIEGVGASLLEDPLTAIAGLGFLIGGLFLGRKHKDNQPPAITPSFQFGIE